jgi:heme A synthase
MSGYALFLLGIFIFYDMISRGFYHKMKSSIYGFLVMLIIQIILGITTVIMCKGEVPVLWGVLHQFGALLLITFTYNLRYKIKAISN